MRKVTFRYLATDLILITFSVFASLFLRVNYEEAQNFLPALYRILPIILIFRIGFFIYFEVYNIIWRYVSAVDAFRLVRAVIVSSLFIVATTYLFNIGFVPRSLYFIDSFLTLVLLAGARLARRMFYEYQNNREMRRMGSRTVIYGAGATGQGILKGLLADRELKFFVIGFIDDDSKKMGKSIAGMGVLGGGKDLAKLIPEYGIKQVVVGIPNPPVELLKDLLQVCAAHGIKPLILNSTAGGIEVKAPLRELELKDLLRRPPHEIDLHSTQKMLQGRRVLITGAGGTIGSEIARQVMSFGPSRLMILDHSEFNLYSIDQEFTKLDNYSDVVVPCLVDMKDYQGLEQVFSRYMPEIVFHAAAYKHVHLVESNPYTSILNNVLGMKNLLALSEKANVEKFVLISTDKAVNPAGVMGSTKRICEIMTSLAGFSTNRGYCAVRFGNVLGSSGSLIPLLKKQIESGFPLTITHKDVTRYFMLIEEAVSLVLKAASISKPGDINVLKMGEPIKIIDVAKNLVRLMGKNEDDVEYQFTGLRPGEKMFEELYISGNELDTEHPDILVVPKGDALPKDFLELDFNREVENMLEASKHSDKNAIFILGKLVNSNYEHPTYSGQLLNLKSSD